MSNGVEVGGAVVGRRGRVGGEVRVKAEGRRDVEELLSLSTIINKNLITITNEN